MRGRWVRGGGGSPRKEWEVLRGVGEHAVVSKHAWNMHSHTSHVSFNVKSPPMGMISSMPPKESSSKDHPATDFGAILDPSGANQFLSHVLGSLLWFL